MKTISKDSLPRKMQRRIDLDSKTYCGRFRDRRRQI